MDEVENRTGFTWLISTSNLSAGGSAIIGDNYTAFYAIHSTALFLISVSLVSSLIVIINITLKLCRSSSKICFSTRLPLYLALADFAWSLSHFSDHFYLAIYKVFPVSEYVKLALSINMGFFFGYQQAMQTCVAVYTYAGVVHGKKFNLGRLEWRLHLLCITFLAISVVVFIIFNGFGNAGYWMAHDATSISGKFLSLFYTCGATFSACCVTLSYFGVRRAVINSNAQIKAFTASGSTQSLENSTNGRHTTATQCLTTFVWVASCIYCPHALLLWFALVVHVVWDAVEPISCGLIVVVANSGGWANAYAYIRNEKLKRVKNGGKSIKSAPTSTTDQSL